MSTTECANLILYNKPNLVLIIGIHVIYRYEIAFATTLQQKI